MYILDPKISHLCHFGHNHFPQKIGSVTFLCSLNPNTKLKSEKSNGLILRKQHYRRMYKWTELSSYDPLAELRLQ